VRIDKGIWILSLAVIFLGGCESLQQKKGDSELDRVLEPLVNPAEGSAAATSPATVRSGLSTGGGPPIRRSQIYPGTGVMVGAVAESPAAQPGVASSDGYTLNFDNTPLAEVVKSILGDMLGENFVLEPGLAGAVTMSSNRPLAKKSLLPILESILQVNGAALVRTADGRYRVGPRELLKGLGVPLGVADTRAGYQLRVVSLSYISVAEMAKILNSVGPSGGVVMVDKGRNLMVLGGIGDELANMLQTIDVFDVDVLKGMSVGIYPTENIPAGDMAENLQKLFGAEGESPLGGLFRIVPLESAGRVMVITSRPRYLKEIATWIERLDFDDGTTVRLHVYHVQNGSAERLAEILNSLYAEAGSRAPTSRGDVAPGARTASLGAAHPLSTGGDAAGGDQEKKSAFGAGSAGLGGAAAGGGVSDFSLSAGVRVVADTDKNTLIIMADSASYQIIENTLRQLDVEPQQILIEANIVEVTLSDDLQYGLQWYFERKVNGKDGAFSLTDSAAGLVPKVPGFNWTLTDSAGVVNAVLSALAQDSRLRVISSPSLLVLNHHSAKIAVGQQQPVKTGTTVSGDTGDQLTESIEYKDTGVTLEVTPHLNTGGMAIMEVAQDVTDVGEIDVATGQRAFLQRNIQSTVAVQSGQTIVLGGLIRDNDSQSSSGIPVLHQIPVVGGLFGTKTSDKSRTELLVTLTPRVLSSGTQTAEMGREMRQRMRNLIRDIDP